MGFLAFSGIFSGKTAMAVILLGFSHLSYAEMQTERGQPCMQIKKACEGSGSQRGKIKECMKRITAGEAITGIDVPAGIISGCKEKHEN